ncbi:MAG: hypothetical protein KGH65_03740 [Candidatus Micrarchaeota archaeon]|nr:hypothetical protein [Candidatus Micrarchaeota archaeon]
MAHTVHVKRISEPQLKKIYAGLSGKLPKGESLCGLYDHTKHTIYLADSLTGTELEQTFLHEKMHCLLESAGKQALSDNEGFVDLLSELLHQSIVTAKGAA